MKILEKFILMSGFFVSFTAMAQQQAEVLHKLRYDRENVKIIYVSTERSRCPDLKILVNVTDCGELAGAHATSYLPILDIRLLGKVTECEDSNERIGPVEVLVHQCDFKINGWKYQYEYDPNSDESKLIFVDE